MRANTAIKNDIPVATGCAIHAPSKPYIGGNMYINGINNNTCRDIDNKIDIHALPIL